MDSYARGPSVRADGENGFSDFFGDSAAASPIAKRSSFRIRRSGSPGRSSPMKWRRPREDLIGLGLAPGDRVGVWATNCAEWIYLQLGCARAGLVQVNVNPAYRAHGAAYVLKKSGMKALVLRARGRALELSRDSRRGDARRDLAAAPRRFIWAKNSWDHMIANGADVRRKVPPIATTSSIFSTPPAPPDRPKASC